MGLALGARQGHVAHIRHSIAKLQRLDKGRILLSVSKDGMEFCTATGSMIVRWKDLKEIRVTEDYWLLLRAPNDFSTLPLTNITSELQNYLLSQFRAAGVRVRLC